MELKVRVNRSIKEFHAQRYLVRDPDDLAECLSSRLLITEPSDTSTGEEEGAVRESTQEAERASNQDSGYASNSNTGHADLDEEHLAAATLRFLDQAGLLRRGKPKRKSKRKRTADCRRTPQLHDNRAIDVLVSVRVRDVARPDRELLPPFHIEFTDCNGRAFGYLFSCLLDERTKDFDSFGVRRLGGIKKIEATIPCALDEELAAEMKRRGRRTEYGLEGIADWVRMEKLWRDFLDDTKITAERVKEWGRFRCIDLHGYVKVILYFRPEYGPRAGDVST